MLANIFINQIGLIAKPIFSHIYCVLGTRKYDMIKTVPDLEGLLGSTGDVWHWYRSLSLRCYLV